MTNVGSKNNFFKIFIIILFYTTVIGTFLFLPRIMEYWDDGKSLNVYTFAGLVAYDVIEAFEKEHNVKVSLKYYDSNEELFAKFKISGGEGYDVVMPSDYMIDLLIKEELLHKLDHHKIADVKNLDNRLLGHYFDKKNEFSLPMGWTPYGILYSKKIFKKQPKQLSLDLLFKSPEMLSHLATMPYKISMKDDYREAILLSSLYLFGDIKSLTPERLKKIRLLLIKQKSWVENYLHQDIGYFFIADIIHVAIADSSYSKKVMEESDDFDFIIPKEGSFVSIENMAIPKSCKKVDLAHKFIAFVLSKKQSLVNTKAYGLNPSNKEVYPLISKKFFNNPNFFPDSKVFGRLHVIHNNLPIKHLEKIWLDVKGA